MRLYSETSNSYRFSSITLRLKKFYKFSIYLRQSQCSPDILELFLWQKGVLKYAPDKDQLFSLQNSFLESSVDRETFRCLLLTFCSKTTFQRLSFVGWAFGRRILSKQKNILDVFFSQKTYQKSSIERFYGSFIDRGFIKEFLILRISSFKSSSKDTRPF